MSEVKLSERAQRILENLTLNPSPATGEGLEIWIRQQALAELFNCSRRTIGRCLKELKEANLLTDLNRRHENRCKIYSLEPNSIEPSLTPQGARQLELYRPTFEITFRTWPDWEKYYPQVTGELAGETDIHLLWRQTFDKLYAIQQAKDF